MSRFGALLRRLRLDTGMTQQQLEERSGVSVRAISRLEAGHGGNPRVNTVRLLADALPLEPHEREELLATATGAARRETGGGLVPQQLPAPPGVFVGRCDELAALDEAAMISTISGGGGLGKTWLALHWAHHNLDRFPDGQLFLDLRGNGGEPVDPADAVHRLLDALGVEESEVPASLDARTGLYRSLTTGKQMLILVDDARDTDQVRPLLPGSPTCTVIVTSRDTLAGLVAVHGASPIALDVLNAADARHVLTRRLGRQRMAAEPAAVGRILACCGGLPLALGVVAARAVLRPSASLAEVAAELRDEVDRLDSAAPDRPLDVLPVPRQLPSAVRGFTGRAEPLAALDELIAAQSDSNSAVITGTAGVGKTALAVHWAYRVQDRFPDGTLYINLRGYGPDEPATPRDVLGVFLGALGILPERIPADLDARVGLYRSVLAERRVLIVLDNATSATQVRSLLPGGDRCVVVVTSRADLTGLVVGDGATRIPVELLSECEAWDLVRATIGTHRVDAQPDAVAGLIRACARLPLALRIAAARAVAKPHLTIADLVSELDSEQGRWEALSADEHTAVRAVFDWSYHRLTSEQARMLRRLGLHPGPEFGVHAAAAIAGIDVADARRLLTALADGHLIEPIAKDRYRFHDLLRAYAADRANRDDVPAECDQARRTVLEWYAHHAKKAYGAIAPRLFGWLAGASLNTQACPEITFPGPAEAWEWVDTELVTMAAAARHNHPCFTVILASTSVAALSLQGLWDDAFDVCDIGLAAARRAGDRTAECQLLNSLGCALQCVGRWQEAMDSVHAAAALAHELADPDLQAAALSHLGWMCVEQRQYVEARAHFHSALPLSVGARSGYLEDFVQYSLGVVDGDLLDTSADQADPVHRAVSCWRVAMETFDRATDPRTEELRTRLFALAEVRRLNGLLSPARQG